MLPPVGFISVFFFERQLKKLTRLGQEKTLASQQKVRHFFISEAISFKKSPQKLGISQRLILQIKIY